MSEPYEDDLFKDSTMTFGSHLRELRICLYRAILGIALGFLVGLAVGKHVVEFINAPLDRALQRYYLDKAERKVREKYPDLSPELIEVVLRERKIFEEVGIEPGTLLEQLRQSFPNQIDEVKLPEYQFRSNDLLRPKDLAVALEKGNADDAPAELKRIWKSLDEDAQKLVKKMSTAETIENAELAKFAISLNQIINRKDLYDQAVFAKVTLSEDLLAQLDRRKPAEIPRLNWRLMYESFPDQFARPHPFLTNIRIWRDVGEAQWVRPTSLTATEAFMFWMRASMITGFVLASPWVFYQIWMFIGAGLYPHERKYVYTYLPMSLALFLAGVALTFTLVFDPVLKFLLDFNDWLGIEPSPRISDWMSFVMWMPLGFGISFQLPLVMLFLDRTGIVDVTSFRSGWRVAILAICVLSAVLSPSPDPYSMMLLFAPLTVLYFGGIWLCYRGKKNRPTWD